MGGFAWVTLATNDSYSLGALVLAHSLRRVNTAHQLVVLITPGVTESMKTQLSAVYNVVKLVDVLDSRDADNLALLARPELGITFTKLHCWRLTQYDKCVFLDADTLVLQNCDELFDREELSAAPDAGWPDCFNSGVFVYKPSNDTFKAIIEFALIHGSFDGGDQGLLNLFFSDWPTKDIKKHLPFIYNMVSTASYSYLPAFKQFGQGLKIIHFIGAAKPWLQPFNTETGVARVGGESQHVTQFVQFWWDLFCSHVHPSLSTEMAGLAGALASVTLGAPLTAEQTALEEHLRRQGWEQGNIDYMGKDSFSNIWQKICDTLSSGPQPYLPPAPAPVDEAPAPVAPIAAPVYVSSVEISPTGPIDTSPPASYAPVSAPKPTVVASDSEAAAKAALSETKTVPPEPKSPSVPEIVSTEGLKPTTIETSSQPPVDTPPSSVSPAAVTTPTTLVGPVITPTSAPVDPAAVITSEPVSPPIVLPTTVAEISAEASVAAANASSTPIPLPATPSEISGQEPLTPVLAPVTLAPVSLSSILDSTTPLAIPTTPAATPTTPAAPPTTPLVAPTPPLVDLITPLSAPTTPPVAPTTPVSVPTTPPIAPATPVSVPTTPPVAPTTPESVHTIPSVAPTTQVSVPTTPIIVPTTPESATTPIAVPTEPASVPISSVPSCPLPSPAVGPDSILPATPAVPPEAAALKDVSTPSPPTPTSVIAVPALTSLPSIPSLTPTTPIIPDAPPALEVLPSAPTGTATSGQEKSDPAPLTETPVVIPALSTPISDNKAIPLDIKTPDVPASSPAPTEKTSPPSETSSTPVPTTPTVTEVPTPKASEGSPVKIESAVISSAAPTTPTPVQPQTPTVTEPTPPTSPAAGSVEAPLIAKLQVDTEVPATPPVGTSSTAPPLATEEPPVPPKRKGGAKGSQDSKNHKGGKPAKGKK